MGQCGDCRWLGSGTAGLLQRNYCTYFSTSEKYFFVSLTGSCDHFSQKATPGNSGYTSGSGGCFLTSACVEYQGKADDCAELTALRRFRDEYMKSTKEGAALVDEYYSVAPEIVARINESDKKETYYRYIGEVIKDCLELINAKENEKALNKYKLMVETLRKEFDLS